VRAELQNDGFDQVHVEQQIAVVAPQIAAADRDRPGSDNRQSPGQSFGLVVNRFDWGGGREELAARLTSIAQRAESAGFRDLWVMDHFRQIPQLGRAWEDMPEAYITSPFWPVSPAPSDSVLW
jgi:hypothetical protein